MHNKLDRHLAGQLLDWSKTKKLAKPIEYKEQVRLILGVKENALLDADFDIMCENQKIYCVKNSEKREVYVYPAMWMQNSPQIPTGSIAVSDKLIINSMPQAYSLIRNSL